MSGNVSEMLFCKILPEKRCWKHLWKCGGVFYTFEQFIRVGSLQNRGSLQIINKDGIKGVSPRVFLGHELAHAQDNKNGTDDKTTSDANMQKTDPDSHQKGVLTNSEIKVKATENKIRTENKIINRKTPE